MQKSWHLCSRGLDTCTLVHSAPAGWMCHQCRHPRTGFRVVDIHIQEKKPPGGLMSWSVRNGLCLVRTEFAQAIQVCCEASECFVGSVYDRSGRIFEGWRVLRHRVRQVIRARDGAKRRTCEACGTLHYHAIGPQYLVGTEPHAGWFASSDLCGLLVGESAYGRCCPCMASGV